MSAPIPLSLGAYKRSLEPEAILLNAFVEKAPAQQENPVAIRARCGFDTFKTVGAGPIWGIMAKGGLFSDTAIVVSGNLVYLVDSSGAATAQAGTLTATDLVDIDAGQDADLNPVCRIATGTALYKLSAGAVAVEVFPEVGGAGASSVCEHRGFWFATETGTEQAFYQVPGDTSWTALSFASAEYSPDPLKGVRSRGDQFVLLGSETTEVWALTGQADPAIAPYGGLNFDFGCRSIRTAVNCAGTLIWVDHRCSVRLFAGGAAQLISDHGLTEQIAAIDPMDLRASWYSKDQHQFYVLTLGSTATWVYDLTTSEWHRASSLALDYCRAHLFASLGDVVLAADSLSAKIYMADTSARSDSEGGFPVEFTAFAEVLEGQVVCANVELVCETGTAPLSGAGANPVVQMRYSDDGGKTKSRWRNKSLGQTGKYSQRVRWSGLADISAPYGRIFYFRVTDPVGRRFSTLQMNAP